MERISAFSDAEGRRAELLTLPGTKRVDEGKTLTSWKTRGMRSTASDPLNG